MCKNKVTTWFHFVSRHLTSLTPSGDWHWQQPSAATAATHDECPINYCYYETPPFRSKKQASGPQQFATFGFYVATSNGSQMGLFFIYFWSFSNRHYNFYNELMWKMVLGFETTTFRLWVSSHNHFTTATAVWYWKVGHLVKITKNSLNSDDAGKQEDR